MDLEIDHLRLAIGGRILIGAMDARVLPGQFWCVLGRNGAGKSTLLRTIAGLRAPEGGEIRLEGRPLDAWPLLDLARKRAFLPQQVSDHFPARVDDTVMTARFPYQFRAASRFGYESHEDRIAVQLALDELDLGSLSQRNVLSLSGGERRRVSLAGVFAQATPLMLLDEPSAHLDMDVEQRVFKRLAARASAGASIIASVHDPNLAERYASHVILIGEHGETRLGPVGPMLSAQTLAKLYAHPVRELAVDGRRWFAPNALG
jgi:iron complex transport system ATP-binding protein